MHSCCGNIVIKDGVHFCVIKLIKPVNSNFMHWGAVFQIYARLPFRLCSLMMPEITWTDTSKLYGSMREQCDVGTNKTWQVLSRRSIAAWKQCDPVKMIILRIRHTPAHGSWIDKYMIWGLRHTCMLLNHVAFVSHITWHTAACARKDTEMAK